MDHYSKGFLKRTRLHILLLVFLGLLVYSNTFTVPFLFDDLLFVQQLQSEMQASSALDNTAQLASDSVSDIPGYESSHDDARGPWASRPMLYATLVINQIIGGFDTFGYHLVNILLHLANGILLYFLIIRTGRHLERKAEDIVPVALIASLIFMLHPIQTGAVTYIVSRSMLMATLFYFIGTILFLKSISSLNRKFLIGLMIVTVLGAASREDFATFPAMLLLYDIFFISKFRLRSVASNYRQYAALLPGAALAIYLSLANTYENYTLLAGLAVPPDLRLSPVHYILTQFKVHWSYIRLLLLPVNQSADYYGYIISTSLFDTRTMLAFVGYLGLWAVGIFLSKKKSVVGFGILWFLITLLPISFIVAFFSLRLGDVMFEHRLYLPSAGLIFLIALAFVRLIKSRKIFLLAVISVCLALGTAAYARNAVWATAETLWADTVAKFPGNPRAHNNLAMFYYGKERYEEAINHLNIAAKTWPDFAQFHSNIGLVYLNNGMLDKAVESLKSALALNPNNDAAHADLGMAYYKQKRHEEALEHFLEANRLRPGTTCTLNNIAATYNALGDKNNAINYYVASLWMNARQPQVLHNVSVLFLETGQNNRAAGHLEGLVEIDPTHIPARLELGKLYTGAGLHNKAIEHLRAALELKPDEPEIHRALAEAYGTAGDMEQAKEHAQRYLDLLNMLDNAVE